MPCRLKRAPREEALTVWIFSSVYRRWRISQSEWVAKMAD
jgi:hypothetical protein